jgi:hypothetical protein
MPKITVKLNRATRIDGRHAPAGSIVEVDGRAPETGHLQRDARYLIGRGFATELSEDEAAEARKAAAAAAKAAKG